MRFIETVFSDNDSRGSWREWLCVCVAALVAYLPQLLGRGLWEFDEVRWSLVARELLASDNWLVLTLVGDYYPDKPPLYFWFSAGLMALMGGANPWSPRLLSAAAVVATGLLILATGNRLFGRPVGLVAALLWITSLLAGALSGAVNVDTFYVAWLTGAFGALAMSVHAGRWNAARAIVFGLGVTAAMMSKGPIGVALPLAVVLSAWALGVPLPRRTGSILAWSIIAPLALTCLWLVAAARVVGLEPIAEQVGLHGFGYAARTSWSHPKPFWFFLGTFWLDFFPVSLLFPAALAALAGAWAGATVRKDDSSAARKWSGSWGRMRGALRAHPAEGLLLAWFFSIFLVHSAISAKRSPYILPTFPAAALLVALAYARYGNATSGACTRAARIFRRLDAGGRWVLTGLLGLLGLAGVLHPLYLRPALEVLMSHVSETPGLAPPQVMPWQQAIMIVGGIAAWGLGWVIRPRRVSGDGFRVLPGFMAAGILVLFLGGSVAVPMLDDNRSGRHLIEFAKPYLAHPGVYFLHRARGSAWLLAWHCPVGGRSELIRNDELWLKRFQEIPPPVLGVMRRKDYEDMRERFPLDSRLLGEGLLGTTQYYLVGRGFEAMDRIAPDSTSRNSVP